MKKRTLSICLILLMLSFPFHLIDAFAESYQYESLTLDINWSHIQSVGHQSSGQACACFSYAYMRTILDGKVHYWTEFNSSSGNNQSTAIAPWNGSTYTGTFPSDKTAAYNKMYSELSKGKPVVVKVTGSRSSHHYVAVVGFVNVTSSLSANNFLIIDPCASSFIIENMGGVGYDLKYEENNYQVEYDTTSQTVNFTCSYGTYLDLGLAYVDGVQKENIDGVGAFDVYIKENGASDYHADAENVSDYKKSWPKGTQYEIRNIRGFGYEYIPQPASGVTGTIGDSGAYFSLLFTTVSDSSTVANTMTFNGHLYERYDYHLTWTEAKAFCESKGGHLVSITSEEEQAAVVNLLNGCPFGVYYLGGTDMNQSGNWSWVDGESFTYSNWDPDYPEPGQTAGEYYNAIIGIDNPPNKAIGEWIDCPNEVTGGFYGKQNSGFICEYEKTYTISYNANGGSGAPESQSKLEGEALTLSSTAPTWYSYEFKGWALSPSATSATYQPADSFSLDQDTILYAVWERLYRLQYDSNGGADAPNPSDFVHYQTALTVSAQLPSRDGYKFLGWATTSTASQPEYQPVAQIAVTQDITLYAVWQRVYASDWSETRPEGVRDEFIETRTQYRYSSYETTTSTSSSLDGWTSTGESTVVYGDYGPWSSWSTEAVSKTDTRDVGTTTLYRYYYYYCPQCGRHEPLTGLSDCGKYTLSGSDFHSAWFDTPYSQSNYKSYSYTSAKYYTNSLGDSQEWCFSAGNLNNTAVGTKDTDSDAIVITTGYHYRTRTETTQYSFYRWSAWSDWSDKPIEANDTTNVETQTLYRCVVDADKTLTIPASTQQIASEAFQGIAAGAVIIPESVRSIADDAFDEGIVLIGKENSYAQLFAGWNGHGFISQDN